MVYFSCGDCINRFKAVFQRFELEATYLALSANVVNAAIQEASLREQIAATEQIIDYESKIIKVLRKGMVLGNTPYSEIIFHFKTL